MCDDELREKETILEACENELEAYINPINRHKMYIQKNIDVIKTFLGKEPWAVEAYSTAHYYGNLLAWTVKFITTLSGWEVVSNHGYSQADPVFRDVQTDYTKNESCLIDGVMLVKKQGVRLVITVCTRHGYIEIKAGEGEEHHDLVKKVIKDVADLLKEHNFYRNKTISFNGEISFLNVGQVEWASVVMDAAMKNEIRLNTIGFLNNCARFIKYGIPPKRGIILAGEPGTGKTMACKALISEADKITCIVTNAYGMVHEGYISDLFAIAQDLSPSLIFMEDLDSIGQERYGAYRGSALLVALLAEMDGIAEKTAVVTVATTNNYQALDKALRERPQRFDRLFQITRPNAQLRAEIVEHVSEKIILSDDVKEYIVKVSNGLTPAQLQEVIFGMVISHIGKEEEMHFTRVDADLSIGWLKMKETATLGFNGVL
jgi:cell division protease FtsH